jgi:hypothetical protein
VLAIPKSGTSKQIQSHFAYQTTQVFEVIRHVTCKLRQSYNLLTVSLAGVVFSARRRHGMFRTLVAASRLQPILSPLPERLHILASKVPAHQLITRRIK